MNDQSPLLDLTSLDDSRVTVMGLGDFGGGSAAVRFLTERGARVRVSDQRSHEQLHETISTLADIPGIDWRLGTHDWSQFADADFVVLNPAIPPRHAIVQRLAAEKIPVTSEMNLFWQLNPGRTIAVTGSNGKSTTASLIHSILQASGQQSWLGGNIGRSLLPHVSEIAPDDWVVLEVSSFQLHLLDRIEARPDIAVVTNFAPNHLDWHVTLDDYRLAKQSILKWQTEADWCVLNGDDADVSRWPHTARAIYAFDTTGDPQSVERSVDRAWIGQSGSATIQTGSPELNVSELPLSEWCPLRGRHNLSNALLSATAARLAGASTEALKQGQKSFKALPHRLEPVGVYQGRQFYNDSISTTPESTIAALAAFDEPIVLLAGGYDKKVSLSELSLTIAEKVKAVSLLGQTASVLRNRILKTNPSLPLTSCSDFSSAFEWAVENSSPGDIVLLSPGCASYDWFKSYVDRGECFRRCVEALQ